MLHVVSTGEASQAMRRTERGFPKLALEGREVCKLWLRLLLLMARPLLEHHRVEQWWKRKLLLPGLPGAERAVTILPCRPQFAALQRRDMVDAALARSGRDSPSLARTWSQASGPSAWHQ